MGTQASLRRRLLVVAALMERGDEVLVAQRRANQSLPLHWEFPGGKVEPGESPECALEREIKEELNCEIDVGPIFDVVFHPYPDFDLVMLVYRASVRQGEPSAHDVAAVRWVPKAELPNLTMGPADLPLARRLAGLDKA
jgi:8-oxo-dGTP diphosphatase